MVWKNKIKLIEYLMIHCYCKSTNNLVQNLFLSELYLKKGGSITH